MGYVIDQLVEKKTDRPVKLSEIVIDEDSLPSKQIEFETSEETRVYKVFDRDDFVKDSSLKFEPVYVHRGSVENTPFPTYKQENGLRKVATEKVIYHIYKELGEGLYNYRWMGGQNPRMSYLLQRKYIRRVK